MVYDCIVLGVGGVGSFAFRSAAQRGWKTLGIERFGAVHGRGSSHGRTRIIRTAYFEHPNYVPLARMAWEAWENLQTESDVKLVQKTGLLQVGRPAGSVIHGVLKSAQQHEIPLQQLTPAEAARRFPVFKIPNSMACVFEESAGFLSVENCVAHAIRLGTQAGGELRCNSAAQQISVGDDGLVAVRVANDTFRSKRLIVCAGAWSPSSLDQLNLDIHVLRKQQQWFQLDRVDIKYENGFPAYLIEDESGCFYGFPEIDYLGMKVAEHSGGQPVSDPENVNRDCDRDELGRTEAFMDAYLNYSRRRLVHHSVCMYSMSRDGHFIVDRHPNSDQIVFACGLSGHGFKFAPVLGEHLVGLLDKKDEPLFEFLKFAGRSLQNDGSV